MIPMKVFGRVDENTWLFGRSSRQYRNPEQSYLAVCKTEVHQRPKIPMGCSDD